MFQPERGGGVRGCDPETFLESNMRFCLFYRLYTIVWCFGISGVRGVTLEILLESFLHFSEFYRLFDTSFQNGVGVYHPRNIYRILYEF